MSLAWLLLPVLPLLHAKGGATRLPIAVRGTGGPPRGALSQADERRPDTALLQQAIEGCGAGKAVELKPAPPF